MTEQGLALAVEALRRSAVQMRGVWPRLGFDDLRPLAAIIGDARVVGLGEAAHGAGELFTVKHRLIEYLVVELGFTGVAFEASYAGCQPIDEYVRHGRGVAAEALTGQGYTAWDRDEVSALVEWLRLHNGGVPHDRKVAFYGLDSGYNAVGRRAVLDLVARAAPNHLSAAHEIFSSLETLEPKWPFCFDELDELAFQQAYQGLQELERALADKATSAAQTRRFVRIMAQWAGPDRDDRSRHMGTEFADKWGSLYPAITKLWANAWSEFVPFLDYDVEIRKIICSTNAIESINARYRRAVRVRGHFPNEKPR
jgi:erythromycin esterase-like protein